MNKRWISHEEIARRLGISRPTVALRLETGEVPGQLVYLGTKRVERKVFEEWAVSKDLVN